MAIETIGKQLQTYEYNNMKLDMILIIRRIVGQEVNHAWNINIQTLIAIYK